MLNLRQNSLTVLTSYIESYKQITLFRFHTSNFYQYHIRKQTLKILFVFLHLFAQGTSSFSHLLLATSKVEAHWCIGYGQIRNLCLCFFFNGCPKCLLFYFSTQESSCRAYKNIGARWCVPTMTETLFTN